MERKNIVLINNDTFEPYEIEVNLQEVLDKWNKACKILNIDSVQSPALDPPSES